MKRQLPPYCYRDKGKIIYKRRVGRGWHRATFETQFPEGEPMPDTFLAEYLRIKAGPVFVPKGKTWNDLIAIYRRSDKYAEKAPRTRKDYDAALEYLSRNWGDLDPRKVTQPHLYKLVEANLNRTKFARDLIAVASILLGLSVKLGWRADNPALGMERPKTPKVKRLNRRPWPRDMIQAFRDAAPIGTRARTLFELCLGTGQRIGDVLRMQWGDVSADGIAVRQSKTGARLVIPLTPSLRAVLAAAPRSSLFIAPGDKGMQLTYRAAHHAVMQVRKRIGAEAYDVHALRYTAVAELAEAGCSDELIQSVTGHSTAAMVKLYAGEVRQIARAREAQKNRK